MQIFSSSFKKLFLIFVFIFFLSVGGVAHAATIIDTDITTNTTWTLSGSPYVVTTPISVAPSTTLTISPNVVVKFDIGAEIIVEGNLVAQTTGNQKVTFTSFYDDSIGGNTDGTPGTTGTVGDWGGLSFSGIPASSDTIGKITIKYAEDPINVLDRNLTISNFTCSFSEGCLFGSNANITVGNFIANSIYNNVAEVYNNSSFTSNAVTVSDVNDGDTFVIFNDSNLSVNNANINVLPAGDSGVIFFNHATVSIANSTIINAGNTAVFDLGSNVGYAANSLTLDHVNLNTNHDALAVDDGLVLNTNQLSISGSSGYGAFAYTNGPFAIPNVWWGSDTGPYNALNNPSGLGDQVTDTVDFSPYVGEDTLAIPVPYYAKITNIFGGVAHLYETPTTGGVEVKTLPNDWVVQVVQRFQTGTSTPVIADGYRWYRVIDPTDGVSMWMKANAVGSPAGQYLPYETSQQTAYQVKAATFMNGNSAAQLNARRATIVEAIDHYLANSDTADSLYSSDDHSPDISQLFLAGFSREVILAITSQESGFTNSWHPNKYDNEFVSFDYGHGVLQVTMDALAHEPNTFSSNKDDPRGRFSDVTLKKCEETSSLISSQNNNGTDEYKKCYGNTNTSKPYKNYDNIQTNPKYKQYANTKQSIYSNLKDGLGVLKEKNSYANTSSCSQSNLVVGGITFTCNDIKKIKTIWGYNGISFSPNHNYMLEVSQKLSNLATYFPGYTYSNSDQLIQKLVIANAHRKEIKVHSPVELRVSDSQGNITGVVNGVVENTVENSMYDPSTESVAIFFPNDTYTYQIVGDSTGGIYGLDVTPEASANPIFTATTIPISTGEIHTYRIDEPVLAAGGNGVTLEIDTNGDGIVEETIITGATLTDIQKPIIDLSSVTTEQVLGGYINLQTLITDNITPFKNLVVTAALDSMPLTITKGKIKLSLVGTRTLTITATDTQGNQTTTTKQLHVSYLFDGFNPPIANYDPVFCGTWQGPANCPGSYYLGYPFHLHLIIKGNNGVTLPSHPGLLLTRVSDSFQAQLNLSQNDSNGLCDLGENCFVRTGNNYNFTFNTNQLTIGNWRLDIPLEDETTHSIIINIHP